MNNFKSSVRERANQLTPAEINQEWSSYKGRERVLLRKRRTKLKLEQFHIITQVGQGGYGEVYLARRKDTGQVVALKKMRKRTLLKMDEVRYASNGHRSDAEDSIDPSCTHRARYSRFDQFTVARQTSLRLPRSHPRLSRNGAYSRNPKKITADAMVQDFIAGGDFRTLLNNSGVLKEEHARFYISEMFCAVSELHKLGYIHRDLKPEV